MYFLDTHCHIDLYPNFNSIVERSEREQIYTIAVTNTPSTFRQSSKLTTGRKFLRTALGLHPELVAERHRELGLMMDMLGETKYIGEVGLDFTTNSQEERDLQEKVFSSILKSCADSADKILTIHSRRAAGRVIDLIGNSYPGKAILHWYSGSLKEMERALSYGFYFSVNLSMISSSKGKEIISAIPKDRLLTESDGPFVKANGGSADPSHMNETVKRLSELLKSDLEKTKSNIYQNFQRILTT